MVPKVNEKVRIMANPVLSGNQRPWSTTEEADLSSYKADEAEMKVYEDYAAAVADGLWSFIFAIGDNLYLVTHPSNEASIYWTNSLQDAMDTAFETVIYAER
jgi:hypothetical protein